MTHTEMAHIDCPQCQTRIAMETYTQVDVSLNPELRDRFLSADPFQVTCPHCGHQGLAEYDFLYQDLDHGFVLFYEPNPDRFEADAQLLAETYADHIQAGDLRIRVVHGLPNFWEKIQIFEAGLDDRVIELQKFLVFALFHQQQPEEAINRIFFETKPDQDAQFLLGNDQQLIAVAGFDQGQYDLTQSSYQEALDLYGGGFFVTQQWAEWLIEQSDDADSESGADA